MTPMICIKPKHRRPGWLTLDLRDDEFIETAIVVPSFGPDHHVGMDCWCQPSSDGECIVHNAEN